MQERSGATCHMAMPQCCYLAKGAKRPSHTTNTIEIDSIPFDPCNSIERFDLCPFDQKNSTYLQPLDRPLQYLQFPGKEEDFAVWQEQFEVFCFTKKLLNVLSGTDGEIPTQQKSQTAENGNSVPFSRIFLYAAI